MLIRERITCEDPLLLTMTANRMCQRRGELSFSVNGMTNVFVWLWLGKMKQDIVVRSNFSHNLSSRLEKYKICIQEKVDGTNVGVHFDSEYVPICQKRRFVFFGYVSFVYVFVWLYFSALAHPSHKNNAGFVFERFL
jgi:hypothetical protein